MDGAQGSAGESAQLAHMQTKVAEAIPGSASALGQHVVLGLLLEHRQLIESPALDPQEARNLAAVFLGAHEAHSLLGLLTPLGLQHGATAQVPRWA